MFKNNLAKKLSDKKSNIQHLVVEGSKNNNQCNDIISRQAAIDALDRIFDRCEEIEAHLPEGDPDRTGYKMYPDYVTVWKYLHQLTSAQPPNCEGCKHLGKWENEVEYGYPSPCTRCKRRVGDHYER